jgi:hypothetical protein
MRFFVTARPYPAWSQMLSPQGGTIVARRLSAGEASENLPESRAARRHNGTAILGLRPS